MKIKNLKPNFSGKYKQGYFRPTNPHKYAGDSNNIIFRSSWEYRFMVFLDTNEHVLAWGSEIVSILYFNPYTSSMSQYYVDFIVKIKIDQDTISEYLIEIKPEKHIHKPTIRKNTKSMKTIQSDIELLKTYIINQSKFEAAKKFAEQTNRSFVVLTENSNFNFLN